jgi:hypothetical protein
MPRAGMWDALFTARFKKLGRKDFQKRKEWPRNFSTLGIANLLRCGCAGLAQPSILRLSHAELDDYLQRMANDND